MECFIGQIEAFAFDYVPVYWLPCDGREVPIQRASALFALLGTTYGGNGTSTFKLPDLRGRIPMGRSDATGNRPGTMGGSETHALAPSQMAQHVHPAPAVVSHPAPAQSALPLADAAPAGALSPSVIAPAGQGQAHDNMMPSLALLYCICVEGTWPATD